MNQNINGTLINERNKRLFGLHKLTVKKPFGGDSKMAAGKVEAVPTCSQPQTGFTARLQSDQPEDPVRAS